jgi:ligand-binding SRPBCC domain-containing protein
MYELRTWLWLPRARHDVFAFFADARNLQRITPAFLNVRILTPDPIAMRQGTIIDYRLSLRGVPFAWRTEIAVWDPPDRFVDIQQRGPYAEWIHTHAFEEQGDGTLVRDHVRYRLYGPRLLTRLVHRAIVARDLRQIFAYRHAALGEVCGGRGRPGPLTMTRTR